VTERHYLWILNNFLHDTATGTWAACVLVVWMLAGRLTGMPAPAAEALGDSMITLFRLALGSLVVIGATGGVRLCYWRRQSFAEDLPRKRRALLAKHVVFAVTYGAGTAWLYTLVR
jgi:hypothetical protein